MLRTESLALVFLQIYSLKKPGLLQNSDFAYINNDNLRTFQSFKKIGRRPNYMVPMKKGEYKNLL